MGTRLLLAGCILLATLQLEAQQGEASELVTMEFADADIRVVLDLLARQVDRNIVIHPDVQGKVSVNILQVPWLDALSAIAESVGCVFFSHDAEMTLVRVVPAAVDRSVQVLEVIPLRHRRPPPDGDWELLCDLRTILDTGGVPGECVAYDAPSSSFIVNASRGRIQQLRELVGILDQPQAAQDEPPADVVAALRRQIAVFAEELATLRALVESRD